MTANLTTAALVREILIPMPQIGVSDVFKQTTAAISKHESDLQELSLVVETAKGSLESTKAQLESVKAQQLEVNAKLAESEAAKAAALADKGALTSRLARVAEDEAVLDRQLNFLSQALADVQRRLDTEKSEYEQELETHRSKLDQLKGLEAMAA